MAYPNEIHVLIRQLEMRVKDLEAADVVNRRRIKLLERHNDDLYQTIFGRPAAGLLSKTARVVRLIRNKIHGGSDVRTGE